MIQFNRLRLSGFKSFVDRTELDIGNGLTGIVGPNGCGKSNLVEALRWVMGENSAKRMRGGGMEDVIFAGTAKRTARNIAEVSLLLGNTARDAPAAYNASDEIEVVRKIEKDHGSNYKINGRNMRARDVQMLFADSVIGSGSPALVSQGRVTKIIDSKPLERRLILEESAGISGLYARRHEAELRLKAADGNLLRVEDIVGSMEDRLAALKRQARQASRYRNINAQIRQLELTVAHLEWSNLNERIQKNQDRFEKSESIVADKFATVTQLTKTQNTQSEELPPLRQQEAEIAATAQTQKIALQRLEDESNRLEQLLEETKEQIAQTKTDHEHESNILKESTELMERMEGEQKKLLDEQEQESGKLEEKDKTRAELEKKVLALEEKHTALMESAAESRARKESLAQQITQNEDRIEIVTARKDKAKSEYEALAGQAGQEKYIKELNSKISDLEEKAKKIDEDMAAAYETAQNAQKRANEERTALTAIESKKSEFNAEISMLESFFEQDSGESFSPVLDQVAADTGFEKALSRALGDSLMASLEENAPSSWIKRSINNLPSLPQGTQSLLPHIKAPEALHLSLSQIGFVQNESDGDRLVQELSPGQSLVSASGTYWRWDGYRVKSTATDRHSLHLEQKNKLGELEKKRPQIAELFAAAEKALERSINQQDESRQKHESLQAELRETHAKLTELRQSQGNAHEEQAKRESENARLKETIATAAEDIDSLQATIEKEKTLLSVYEETEDDEQTENADEVKQALLDARSAHQTAMRAFDLYQQEQNSRKARLHAISDERINLKNRSIRAAERLKDLGERDEMLEGKLEELKRQPKDSQKGKEELLTRITDLEKQRQDAADALAKCENEVSETGKALKQAESMLGEARESRAHAQATLDTLREQMEGTRASVKEHFDMEPQALTEHLTSNPEGQDVESLRAKKEKISRERDNIGPVNLRADDETQELEAELATLLHERNDLAEAIAELRGGIAEINKEARERLLAAFEHVNAHFQDLFTRLFGGGKAYLALIDSPDSKDPLGAGLEIFAEPPGKTLQSLSLLSGGEQTLASIALIFAMFLTNPSPICVLDEIDAPLDDANVDRVCDLLDDIAERGETRFLVITHHRLTMARMDRLYGVTMAEKGVSQLVSVDLQQSFDFLEAA